MSLEEVVAGVSKLSNKLVGSIVDVDAPLMEAGLDSLTSVELINELSGAFGVTLSPTVPYDYPTVRELSKHIRVRSSEHGAAYLFVFLFVFCRVTITNVYNA